MSIGEEIANKDLILSKIENEIKNQQNFILSQLTDIEEKRKSNQYLNSIYEDYMKFKEYIVKEKTEQKMVMQKLLSYFNKNCETDAQCFGYKKECKRNEVVG